MCVRVWTCHLLRSLAIWIKRPYRVNHCQCLLGLIATGSCLWCLFRFHIHFGSSQIIQVNLPHEDQFVSSLNSSAHSHSFQRLSLEYLGRVALLLCCHRQENWGVVGLRNLPGVTQLADSRAKNKHYYFLIQIIQTFLGVRIPWIFFQAYIYIYSPRCTLLPLFTKGGKLTFGLLQLASFLFNVTWLSLHVWAYSSTSLLLMAA